MGSLLISVILIFTILKIFQEETEDKVKLIIGISAFIEVMLICIIFNINILLYTIVAVPVGIWVYHHTNFNNCSKKLFLIVVCLAIFFSINVWGIIGSFVLCSYFDYGIITGFYKGFTSMNSSYEFAIELVDELLFKPNSNAFSEELRIIKEQLYPKLEKIDTLKTIIDLIEYL